MPNNSVTTPTCNSLFMFEADTSGNQKKVKYKWEFDDGTSVPNAIKTSHLFKSYGNSVKTYTVKLSVLDSMGKVQNTKTVDVSIKQTPDPSVLINNVNKKVYSTCDKPAPAKIVLQNNSTTKNTTTNKTYSIDWGDASPIWTNTKFDSLTHNYLTEGYYKIILAVEGENGCFGRDTITYYLGSTPASVAALFPKGIIGNNPICTPINLKVYFTGKDNNSKGTTYTVDYGDGTQYSYTDNLPDSLYHPFNKSSCLINISGVPIKIKTENGCGIIDFEDQKSARLKFSSTPIPSITSPSSNTYCVGKPLSFNSSFTEGYNAGNGCTQGISGSMWTISPNTYTAGTLNTSSLNVTFLQAGNYTINYKATNACGSKDTFYIVTIMDLPIADASITQNKICEGAVVIPTNNSTNQKSNKWEITSTTPNGFQFINSTNTNSKEPQIKFTTAGIYYLKLIVTNDCASVPIAFPIKIEVLAKPDFKFDFNISDCVDIKIDELTKYITNVTGSFDTIIIESKTPAIGKKKLLPGKTLGAVTFSMSDIITVTLKGLCGTISKTGTVTITPKADLKINNKPTASSVCSDNTLSIPLQGSSTNGNWLVDGVKQGTGISFNFKPQLGVSENEKDFKILYKGSKCDNADSFTIKIYKKPTFILNSIPSFCNTATLSLNYTSSGKIDSIVWKTTNKGVLKNITNVMFTQSDSIIAKLYSPCGDITQKGFVRIDSLVKLKMKPIKDTLCSSVQKIILKSNYTGAKFRVNGTLLSDSTFVFPSQNTAIYTIIAEGGANSCTISDTFKLTVLGNKKLQLKPQLDDCNTISYKGELVDATLQNVKYTINGIAQNTFPVVLQGNPNNYVVIATYQDFCGIQKDTISFKVFPIVKIKMSKISDTLCSSAQKIILKSNYTGARFRVNGILLNDSTFVFPSQNTMIYTIIAEGDVKSCTISDTFKLTVLGNKKLQLKPQLDDCNTISYKEIGRAHV